jgi:hypothetical protein
MIRPLSPGYGLLRVLDMTESDDHDEGGATTPLAVLNEHFRDAPMFNFCSDSPSVMKLLRKLCVQDGQFAFAFGCAPHALHNLCMDFVKGFPRIKEIVKLVVWLVRSIRKTHLILALFDKICLQRFGRTYVLILYTKTRWGTLCDAVKRLCLVRAAICHLPTEIVVTELDTDLDEETKALIMDQAFWKGVAAVEALLTPICSVLAYLEGDYATFSSVYPCFLAVAHHIRTLSSDVKTALRLDDVDLTAMHECIGHRLRTIYSPAHALTFRTDPLFYGMCKSLTDIYGEGFVQLGQSKTILQQCKVAIKRLAGIHTASNVSLQAEFASFVVRVNGHDEDDDFADMPARPHQIWALADDSLYGIIKNPLVGLHKNPTGTASGERNHKVAKRVHNRSRSRLQPRKVEAGTAIIFNSKQLERREPLTRNSKLTRWLSQIGSVHEDVEEDEEDEEEEEEDDSLEDFNNVPDAFAEFADDRLFSEEEGHVDRL